MAMAPMQTVNDAVRKASMKPVSFSFPVRFRSQVPKRSNRPSRSMISPISAPSAREMIIIMVPWVPRAAESPAAAAGAAVSVTVSIFDIVLPSPITITAKPMDFVTVSRMRSRIVPWRPFR